MKKHNSGLNNPWLITIGGGIIVGAILLLITGIEWDKVFKFIGDGFYWILSFFTGEIKTNLLIFILVFILGIFLRNFSNSLKNKFKDDLSSSTQTSPIETRPNFLKYKEDTFNNMLYRWRWAKDRNGKLIVNEILPFCPKCKCRLVGDNCPICKDSYYGKTQDFVEVEAMIHHKIDSGKF